MFFGLATYPFDEELDNFQANFSQHQNIIISLLSMSHENYNKDNNMPICLENFLRFGRKS